MKGSGKKGEKGGLSHNIKQGFIAIRDNLNLFLPDIFLGLVIFIMALAFVFINDFTNLFMNIAKASETARIGVMQNYFTSLKGNTYALWKILISSVIFVLVGILAGIKFDSIKYNMMKNYVEGKKVSFIQSYKTWTSYFFRVLFVKVLLFLIFFAVLLVVLFIVLLFGILLYKARRRQMISALSSLPFIRPLAREIDLVRFTRSTALLLSSGIPISKTLELSSDVLVRTELVALIEFSRQEVMRGKRLSEALKSRPGLNPQILIRMIAAGEKSGKLEGSFQEASNYFDQRVTTTIKSLTTLLEPVLLVVVGIAVGGIMISIIAPIYQLVGQIKVR